MTFQDPTNLQKTLKHFFGHSQFKDNQKTIIQKLLQGHDTCVIMPTGAGKSLCYQLPALLQQGTALIISPLIALMKNQIDQLKTFNINAAYLSSTLSYKIILSIHKAVFDGTLKLLYLSPEAFTNPKNLDFFQKMTIPFIAIDEAHCISEWGHNFRPEYRNMQPIIKLLSHPPIISLTATATSRVQQDIIQNLGMKNAILFQSSFNRPELYYAIESKTEEKKKIIQYISKYHKDAGIIYCQSRKKTEEIAEFLNLNDIPAVPYHAGLDKAMRIKNQEDFLCDKIQIIVATIAFGMGIDKPNIRFIIHYDMPKSIESYYQETGRAGRDGNKAYCLMFYSDKDLTKYDKIFKNKLPKERENFKILWKSVHDYVTSGICRKKQLLYYFGEKYDKTCNNCDNCLSPTPIHEGQLFLTIVLQTIQQLSIQPLMHHVIQAILAINLQTNAALASLFFSIVDQHKKYSKSFWKSVILQACLENYLEKNMYNLDLLTITKKGWGFIQHPTSFTLAEDRAYTTHLQTKKYKYKTDTVQYDKGLLKILKNLRKKIAQKNSIPPYTVYQDSILKKMTTVYPTNIKALLHIYGIGLGKAIKFGAIFLKVIQ